MKRVGVAVLRRSLSRDRRSARGYLDAYPISGAHFRSSADPESRLAPRIRRGSCITWRFQQALPARRASFRTPDPGPRLGVALAVPGGGDEGMKHHRVCPPWRAIRAFMKQKETGDGICRPARTVDVIRD